MEFRKCGVAVCVVCFLLTWGAYTYLFNGLDAVHVLFRHGGGKDTVTNRNSTKYSSRRRLHHVAHLYLIANNSKTNPPFYPLNGTGQTVDIVDDFDTSRFRAFCTMEQNLEAVIPVYSAAGNFERRKAMRETVGKVCTQMRCKMFFIVGVSLEKDIYNKVKAEYAAVNDILMVNKVDTYRDLNNKVIAMLDFMVSFCMEPKYVIHFIDDFYPNLKLILNQLHQIKRTKFILGLVLNDASPTRRPGSKWYLSEDEYPHKANPPYLAGVLYAFKTTDSAILRQTVHAVDYCWIEDVWFTGHVRQGAGLEPIQLTINFTNNRLGSVQQLRETWNSQAGFHNVDPSNFYMIYNNTVQPP